MRKIYLIAAIICVVVVGWLVVETVFVEPPVDPPATSPEKAVSKTYDLPIPADSSISQMGSPTAPVTMIEYSSLTCPHCATFHNEVLDSIKRDYIDSGKVRLIYHDFFFDRVGLMAAQVVRCAAPEQYFGMLDLLFRTQQSWAMAPDPRAALTQTVRMGGMGKAQVDACLADQELSRTLVEKRQLGEARFQIRATPTFIINGRKIEGSLPYEAFREILDQALKEAG